MKWTIREWRLVGRLRRIVRKCSLAIADAAAWNGAHPDRRPLDVEDFRVDAANARAALEAMERRDGPALRKALDRMDRAETQKDER